MNRSEEEIYLALLQCTLREIRACDDNDDKAERYTQVLIALSLANQLGYDAGFRFDPDEPEWLVAYIDLPVVGQVSWHCPQFPRPWDGHTTDEKYQRIMLFCGSPVTLDECIEFDQPPNEPL